MSRRQSLDFDALQFLVGVVALAVGAGVVAGGLLGWLVGVGTGLAVAGAGLVAEYAVDRLAKATRKRRTP